MSSSVFFHSIREVNWRAWSLACVVAALASTVSIMSSYSNNERITDSLLEKGRQAEQRGDYRQARQDYDLLLLKARASSRKQELYMALLNSSRIDAEFEELELSSRLAREAIELSSTLYGKNSLQTAEAMISLANVVADNDESISLFRKSLRIFRANKQERNCARVLIELASCYDEKQETAAAISASRAAIRILERVDINSVDYAQALSSYATVAELEPQEKLNLSLQAISIQEKLQGLEHPDLAPLLLQAAAEESEYEQKLVYLNRALKIDEKHMGTSSFAYARDIAALAKEKEAHGEKDEAAKLRHQAQEAFLPRKSSLASLSVDFLQSYASLLTELKFDTEAARIRAILNSKGASCTVLSTQEKAVEHNEADDASSDPEYWMRTELIPIDGVKNFESTYYDHIQCWYQHGELKLEAFNEGEIVWSTVFGACPTGIVNMSVDRDQLKVSWRDGDGPVWHNDTYLIAQKKLTEIASTTVDAYVEQIESQLTAVLNGDPDALDEGSVQSVPASYINNNLINEAIQKGEHKALLLYGDGDIPTAAERLGMVFDFVTQAINSQRQFVSTENLSRFEQWAEALKYQGLPVADYITALNDYGYFLQQNDCLDESRQVLQLVTRISPERAVAYLNLGDSYWKLGKTKEARFSYKKYLDLMAESRETRSIPQRILKRVNHESALKSVPTHKSQIMGV